jgi:MoxR-like ATPase
MHAAPTADHPQILSQFEKISRIRSRLNETLRGKQEAIEHVLTCLLARGHLLIEDLPGLGKTTLAKALADAIGGRFARVQCTPDLLPADITGFNMLNQKTREFEFVAGPVFSDVLLADEVNRASPRTQSALLEAMGERQVTVDNVKHGLPKAFYVIATQNPVEHHGTYPLPEAQLDRFAIKLHIGYPDREHELKMMETDSKSWAGNELRLESVIQHADLMDIQASVSRVAVERPVREYLIDLASASRSHPDVSLGLSPRGLLVWQRLSQARAFLSHRDYVTPDDVQQLAQPVLSVRLSGDFESEAALIAEIVESVEAPIYSS